MLEELRKKPKGLKEAYAFWGAFCLTAVVGLVWLASLPIRFSAVEDLATVENQADAGGAFSQFFGQIKDNVTSTWQQNKEAIEEISSAEEANEISVDEPNSTSTTTTKTTPIMIATSSTQSILIATSSEQSR